MSNTPEIIQSEPARQFRLQLVVAAVIAVVVAVVWFSLVWKKRNWPVVTATLSDVQTVACSRFCGGAKTLVYATIEFDRPTATGATHCRIENYNIARGDEKVAATMRIAVRPDSCTDWRLAPAG